MISHFKDQCAVVVFFGTLLSGMGGVAGVVLCPAVARPSNGALRGDACRGSTFGRTCELVCDHGYVDARAHRADESPPGPFICRDGGFWSDSADNDSMRCVRDPKSISVRI